MDATWVEARDAMQQEDYWNRIRSLMRFVEGGWFCYPLCVLT